MSARDDDFARLAAEYAQAHDAGANMLPIRRRLFAAMGGADCMEAPTGDGRSVFAMLTAKRGGGWLFWVSLETPLVTLVDLRVTRRKRAPVTVEDVTISRGDA